LVDQVEPILFNWLDDFMLSKLIRLYYFGNDHRL
jgi:hypothetical protein